ncbi:PREDICTED: CMRF35-like molecule 2 [Crocodylus porosus]|uniref:CMRF35-like molecule 2 n=1 Tax=Crocodylus porosus TaxID=8502 RepID=UPI00093D098A|nr:PREDICTED: CMRF35-like molecule 2 [Crocodylus porosus]
MVRIFLMWVWILFPGCWALIGPQEVNGTVGGSVLVPCQYNEDYQSYRKYWCRGDNWRQCSMDIQTTGSEEEVGQKKLSITDNHTLCIFTVTMKDLQEEDDNTYWCGIERSGYDLMIPVRVFILPAVPTSPTPHLPTSTTSGKEETTNVAVSTIPDFTWTMGETTNASTIDPVLFIAIPSILLVLFLIIVIVVGLVRVSQKKKKDHKKTLQPQNKNFYLCQLKHEAGPAQSDMYMNIQPTSRLSLPENDYENIQGMSQASPFTAKHPPTRQQAIYANMCPSTARLNPRQQQGKCGRKK